MEQQSLTSSEAQTFIPNPPQISGYTDYRAFLLSYYEYKKFVTRDSIRPYTYAMFAAAADIRSPNYLRLVIEGNRNLSREMARRFAKAMQLIKEDAEEFELLVIFSQAKDPLERNRHLKTLNDFRVRKQMREGSLNQESFERVPNWVSFALAAMTEQAGCRFDEEHLFSLLRGKANLEDIRKGLKRLLETGDLVREEGGQVKRGRALLNKAEDIPIALVRKLQAELIYLGLEALFNDDPKDREFGAMTVALTEKEFEQFKFEVRQIRKRWQKDFGMARESGPGDRVFQFNYQLFALTKAGDKN